MMQQAVWRVAPPSAGMNTLQRVLVAGRWICWVWMVGVVVGGLADDAIRHPVVAWSAVAAMLAVNVNATLLARTAPARLRRAPVVAAEAALALAVAVGDGWVFEDGHVFTTSQNLVTEWPLIIAIATGIAAGPVVAAVVGAAFGPARLLSAMLNGLDFSDKHFVSAFATALFYGACGALIGWLVTLLRRSEDAITHHRARDEMARVLHDTVLQTLALVDRRTAAADPELAATARQADRDLRAFLFSDGSLGDGSLSARVHAQVDRVRVGSDVDVVVNVLDDDCRADVLAQEALARAVGESVANAIEHSGATRVVVFVDTRDDGHVFASIRDDGRGFDVGQIPADSHGVRESIIARMAAVGGQAEIASGDGGGTEVRLWTRFE